MTGEKSVTQKTRCSELEALIQQCDGDNPDPELVEQVEQHLETCPVCHEAEDQLSRAVVAYRSVTPAEPSASFEEALVDRLCHKRDPEEPR